MKDNKSDKNNFHHYFLSGIVVLIILFFVSMCTGRYKIPVASVFKYFTFHQIDPVSQRVIQYLRIPRTLIAILVGASLAVSGAIYQSVFNNKLVSPDLLGVSSGASVGACFAILLGFTKFFVSISALLFGFLAVLLTMVIARIFRNKNNVILLLCGLATSGFMSSLVGLMKYLADDDRKLAEMTFWLLGDISAATMNDFYRMIPVFIIAVAVACCLAWQLNILSLGEKEAKSLGVNYHLYFGILILIATLLTAFSVSISGTIGWIGLVIPNMVCLLIGSNNKKVIPVSIFAGAIMMLLVDMLARSLAPNEIPLSVITGILGTPLFIFSIYKKRKEIQ